MNTITAFLILIFSIANNDYQNITSNSIKQQILTENIVSNNPYGFAIEIEKNSIDEAYLVIKMTLHNGSHFVSPHAKRDFSGKFNVWVEESEKLTMDKEIIEEPRSVEENDPHPFVSGLVNWVRVNTTYKYKLDIKSDEDFEISRVCKFVIEPKCTLEEIGFIISQKREVLNVKTIGC